MRRTYVATLFRSCDAACCCVTTIQFRGPVAESVNASAVCTDVSTAFNGANVCVTFRTAVGHIKRGVNTILIASVHRRDVGDNDRGVPVIQFVRKYASEGTGVRFVPAAVERSFKNEAPL